MARLGYLPNSPEPVDIENFAENLSEFEYSSDMPDSIDGVTQFSLEGRPKIYIADRLAERDASETYLRSTIAHECGHVLFHNPCYVSACKRLINASKEDSIKGILAFRNTGEYCWYEWQADWAAASFLMPYRHVATVFHEVIDTMGGIKGSHESSVIEILLTNFGIYLHYVFNVSLRMAQITAECFFNRNRIAIRKELANRGVSMSKS